MSLDHTHEIALNKLFTKLRTSGNDSSLKSDLTALRFISLKANYFIEDPISKMLHFQNALKMTFQKQPFADVLQNRCS